MSRRLKRNEGLTEGLQRVSKELHRDLLQAIGQERLTPAQVHDARKIIKNLSAGEVAPDTRSRVKGNRRSLSPTALP